MTAGGRAPASALLLPIDPTGGPAAANATPERCGAKAAALIRMAAAGLPVPPGFVLTTEVCQRYYRDGRGVLDDAISAARSAVAGLERVTGRGFGDARRPLLLSVRSGAAVSMPGMLETVLNVGLNERSLSGLIRQSGSPRFAWDCYRRLIQQFAEVVHGKPAQPFAAIVDAEMRASGAGETELDFAALERVTAQFLQLYRTLTGGPFPTDPYRQLADAIDSVLRSWMGDKACTFRRLQGLSDEGGTAVLAQAMVYGNLGGRSGAGVGFTRDPNTGEKRIYLDFQFRAQGEDVVSGRVSASGAEGLAQALPAATAQIERAAGTLEQLFGDMQDFEFTIEDGRLYLLQSRAGYRAPLAALAVAVDMVEEGLIDPATALGRLADLDLDAIEVRRVDVGGGERPLLEATSASGGVVVGATAFDLAGVERLARDGVPAILLRDDLTTADIAAIATAEGVIACRGSRTSHAAVVARRLGKVCLVGAGKLRFTSDGTAATIGDTRIAEGTFVSIDGSAGLVYAGRLPIIAQRPERQLAIVRSWQ